METFTPVSALAGGALIGAAAVLFMGLSGRIAGISGILGGLLAPPGNDWAWRAAFVAGLMAAPLLTAAVTGSLPMASIPPSMTMMIVGGLLVGFGTRLGSGCTSGHGVCGIARLSARSVVATAPFVGAGSATVFLVRHVF